MGVRAPEERALGGFGQVWRARYPGPSPAATIAFGLVVLLLLLSNGRPIGAGDTRVTEHVAASLVRELDFDLAEYPALGEPFAREEGGHRVSIYPVLSAVLAAPVFLACRALFALDETGTALAGKLAASALSAVAAALLFAAVARRRGEGDGFRTGLVFALGTSVWSTSQALWQHPAAVALLSLALLWMLRAEEDDVWAGRAGLPLALAVAARHADVLLAAVLAVSLALRWPRRILHLLLWSLPGIVFVLGYQWWTFGSPLEHGFAGSLTRFSEPWGRGHVGLLASPAKGLLVFTPVAAVAAAGLVSAFRRGERALAAALGAAVFLHWVLMGRWSEWHGGESWGPRLMTDALPLLFFFLPEGLDLMPRAGSLLAALSIGAQALGAFSYDYRWERLYQRPPAGTHRELWSPSDSPLAFHLRERVLIFAMPALHDGRAYVREHRVVPFGPRGLRLGFEGERLVGQGAEPTFRDAHLLNGARLDDGKLRFKGRWDGLFLRVLPGARIRPLELRLRGRGRGALYVEERTFWSEKPRRKTYVIDGAFRIRHAYQFRESGGPDLVVTIGKSPGEVALEALALVPPGEPEDVLTTPR